MNSSALKETVSTDTLTLLASSRKSSRYVMQYMEMRVVYENSNEGMSCEWWNRWMRISWIPRIVRSRKVISGPQISKMNQIDEQNEWMNEWTKRIRLLEQ